MIAHPGGDGDHVRLAASQCCGGSERVWRGGAAQGTSQYHRPAASSQQATALPIVSSLVRRTEMPPLWRSSLQRRKRCCGQHQQAKNRTLGPTSRILIGALRAPRQVLPAFLQRSYEQQPIRFTRVRA